MSEIVLFNGTAYCAQALSELTARIVSFTSKDVIMPNKLVVGPNMVYQFEGKTHLLMGSDHPKEFFHALVISKHQLKHCRLSDVQLRKNGQIDEGQQEPPPRFQDRSYQANRRPFPGRRV